MSWTADELTFHENVRCVEMPCCGFTFDADHQDTDSDTWSCPCCVTDDRQIGSSPRKLERGSERTSS